MIFAPLPHFTPSLYQLWWCALASDSHSTVWTPYWKHIRENWWTCTVAAFLLRLHPIMPGCGGHLVQLFWSEHGAYLDWGKFKAVRWETNRSKRSFWSWNSIHLGVFTLKICSGVSSLFNVSSLNKPWVIASTCCPQHDNFYSTG